jgi:hypothetical protein
MTYEPVAVVATAEDAKFCPVTTIGLYGTAVFGDDLDYLITQ